MEDDPSTSNQYAEAQTYSSAVTQIFPGNCSRPTRLPESENIMSAFRGLNLSSGASQIDSGHRVLRGLRNSEVNTYGGDAVGFRVRSANGYSGKIFPLASLEELRNNKDVHLELLDIIGFVREFSTDQFGSRLIQQKLETASADQKNMIFKETLENAFLLITDVFGNYVIQKFFEHGDRQHIRELADKLYTRVLDFSLHTYGCRVIQKAVQFIDYDQQVKLVAELKGHVLMCVIDQNGNHVI